MNKLTSDYPCNLKLSPVYVSPLSFQLYQRMLLKVKYHFMYVLVVHPTEPCESTLNGHYPLNKEIHEHISNKIVVED